MAKPGTNLIEAAKTAGVDIPYYCYHHRLTIAANCRMCLVESSTSPKLVPACQTASGGHGRPHQHRARRRTASARCMEFLLLNHPVDCAICDQAGECKLQDYYMGYDHKPSRLEGGKVLRNKRKVLGPLVVLDQERCILCTRCVRFMDEVAKEPQLGVFGRGSRGVHRHLPRPAARLELLRQHGRHLPGGRAAQPRLPLPGARLVSVHAIGLHRLLAGCNIYVDFMGQDTYRYRPRENDAVNQSWMCDQGRLSYKSLNLERVPQSRRGPGRGPRGRPRAAEALARATLQLKAMAGTAELAVLVSPVCSNEDLLAGAHLRQGRVGRATAVRGRPSGR